MEGQIEGLEDDIEIEIQEIQNIERERHNSCASTLLKFLLSVTFLINIVITVKVYLDVYQTKDSFLYIIFILSFLNTYYKSNFLNLLFNSKFKKLKVKKERFIYINILFSLTLYLHYDYATGLFPFEIIIILLIFIVI